MKTQRTKRTSKETKELIEKHMLKKTQLAGIVRVLGVSVSWLQKYVNTKYENIIQEIKVTNKPKGSLTIECDRIWSFVRCKDNKQWIWLAKDRYTGEIIGAYIGSRDREGSKMLLGFPTWVFIGNVLLVIRIFGQHMEQLSLLKDIVQLAKKQAKPIIEKTLII